MRAEQVDPKARTTHRGSWLRVASWSLASDHPRAERRARAAGVYQADRGAAMVKYAAGPVGQEEEAPCYPAGSMLWLSRKMLSGS